MNIAGDLLIEHKLREILKGSFEIDALLAERTSIGIGGNVALFITPDDDADLAGVLKFLSDLDMPVRVIGNGTNLLISEEHLPFAVLKLSAPFFNKICLVDSTIFARAGATLAALLKFSILNQVSGLEFLAGIPGTLGGALWMNAGVRNIRTSSDLNSRLSISDIVEKIEVMDKQGNIFSLNSAQAGFGYRTSDFKDRIILGAYLRVVPKPAEYVKNRINKFLKKRITTQEISLPSAGCVFKNPQMKAVSAGSLIERAGLKGLAIGDAEVSNVHANFIVNKGKASFKQVRDLIALIQDRVSHDFGIILDPEVEIWSKTE